MLWLELSIWYLFGQRQSKVQIDVWGRGKWKSGVWVKDCPGFFYQLSKSYKHNDDKSWETRGEGKHTAKGQQENEEGGLKKRRIKEKKETDFKDGEIQKQIREFKHRLFVAETKGKPKQHGDKSVINREVRHGRKVAELEGEKMFLNGKERLKEALASFYLSAEPQPSYLHREVWWVCANQKSWGAHTEERVKMKRWRDGAGNCWL